jgi:hypothetical protein
LMVGKAHLFGAPKGIEDGVVMLRHASRLPGGWPVRVGATARVSLNVPILPQAPAAGKHDGRGALDRACAWPN